MISIAVAGASGYAGGEALRLLLNHPGYNRDFTIGALTGASNAGQRFGDLVPGLPQLADRTVEDTTEEVLAGHDVAILGLPHGVSSSLDLGDTIVLDCGADRRLTSRGDWDTYYGGEWPGSWPYGIPELPGNRDILKRTTGVAVPGCFPTGATLALFPAVAKGLVDATGITIVSVTGASGAGKSAKVPMLASEVTGSAKAYGVTTHRHTPEITQNLRAVTDAEVSVSFTPVLAPMARGILTTAVAPTTATADELRELYAETFADEPFVHLLPAGVQPMTASVLGSNAVQLGIEVDERAGRAVFTAAIDNLAKGTAGGAIQSMNIALGLPETAGLGTVGIAP